ncbi:MAG: hypothetical protein R8P61_06345 [Bacteroidia bacterium]|nr:hypothetical protein [Bacteroidia bacterium]
MDWMDESQSMIGAYGEWAAGLYGDAVPELSFRNDRFTDLGAWKKNAKAKVLELLRIPEMDSYRDLKIESSHTFEGLHIEELSWQLPYGPRTKATFLRPINYSGKLRGVLGLHDHSGIKYFGRRKIIRTKEGLHPMMKELQDRSYGGKAWANELAQRGYAVLVPDVYSFGSRRIFLKDVPERIRGKISDPEESDLAGIKAYNSWAGNHESINAKSLFSAGTSWPGLTFYEDQQALHVLANRVEVDEDRLGCGGLSGGGLRTVLLSGLDERIKSAVSVGFMTSWKDFLLHKAYTHTWMIYIPGLARFLDFPEIMALRTPLASLVLSNTEDPLFSLREMEEADQIMKDVYAKAKAADRYRASFYPGGHKFDQSMQVEAFEFFDRFL